MNCWIKTFFVLVAETAVVTLCLLAPASVQAVKDNWLITPQEAAMEPASDLPGDGVTSIGAESDLGPKIEVVKPINGGSAPPPVEVDIKFAQKGSPIDPESLKVSVVKFIDIDITDRVRAHASTAGIHVLGAQIPTGKHTVRISIADKDGLRSVKDVTFEVLASKP
ncbi:MAG: hypothetical protein WA045_04990 [Nitrospira sp.]